MRGPWYIKSGGASSLLEAIDKMTFDHGPTALNQSSAEKSDAKMTPNVVSNRSCSRMTYLIVFIGRRERI